VKITKKEFSMRALLVDDHPLFRDGLRLTLKMLRPKAQVHQAGTVREAIAILEQGIVIDLILLDLQLATMRGLEALHAMRAYPECPPVVILSGTEDRETVRAAIEHGAMGFIQKSMNSDEMIEAVEKVLAGSVYLPAACLDDSYLGTPTQSANDLLQSLGISGRRAEVLTHLAQGKPSKVIARELGISEATVKSHIQAIYDALEVHSRTQALYRLAGHGWRMGETV
jgi:DNA-binding NarL/FixJ family response regulator